MMQKVWSEIKQFATIRRDPLYKPIGRLVWGRFWFVYLLLAVIVSSLSLVRMFFPIHIYPPEGFVSVCLNWLITLYWTALELTIPLAWMFIWALIPFYRKDVSRLVTDLLHTPIWNESIYRVITSHTIFPLFFGYCALNAYTGISRFLYYHSQSMDFPILRILLPQTIYGLDPSRADTIYYHPFYQYVFNPLFDLVCGLKEIVFFMTFPLIAILLLVGYWKERGVKYCLKVLTALFFSYKIGVLILDYILYYLYQLLNEGNHPTSWFPYSFILFPRQLILIFVCLFCLGYTFRLVSNRIPFSEDPQN